jgi:LemA protein
MDYSDDRLQRYINKMLLLQDDQREKPMTDQELKEIALEIGMSEEDWKASQETAKAHLKSGQGHLTYGNWKGAIQELEQANALNPNSVEATYGLANAYKESWIETKNLQDQNLAEKYAQRALQLQPGHSPSLQVLGALRDTEREVKQNNTTRNYVLAAVAGVVLLIAIIFYTLLSNSASATKEEVAKKWAQVENVYQHRADLIPQLVSTVQASANFEKEILDKVIEARSALGSLNVDATKLSESDLSKFQEKQSKMSAALNDLMFASQKNPELRTSQAFRDLQVQIEGSQNRISVERKRYNESIASYNNFTNTFPGTLLGLNEKAYLKMEKGADEVPVIKFE